jgi:hypothetical protein
MAQLGQAAERELSRLKHNFIASMNVAHNIFGEDAFKKSLAVPDHKKVVNKPLFESISVCLSKISDDERQLLIKNRSSVISAFTTLLKDKEFDLSISKSTANTDNVHTRFREVRRVVDKLIQGELEC